jgi:putative colanic acid biosynthesis UDP-glucose lipid carrier transferase
MSQHVAHVTFRSATRMSVGRDRMLSLIEISLDPFVLVFSLWGLTLLIDRDLAPQHVILAVIVFSLTFPGPSYLAKSPGSVVRHIIFSWLTIFGLLFVFGYASGYLSYFNTELLAVWCGVAPACQLTGHFVLRAVAPAIIELQGDRKQAIIAGMNEQGLELARRLGDDPYSRVKVVGFFDDRGDERVKHDDNYSPLGNISALPAFVRKHQVELIYISLPMASQPRILALLDGLRDTTASIYFVPDIFVTDLIQGRVDSVSGLPVVAVCESPFTGFGGLLKRASDIVLSLLILALISVPLIIIALAVKWSSPGPVIFRQRRYGVDGREITVYKFRTMTVFEDGPTIQQAREGDARVTPLGRWLRKFSLDELPQFFNVLQGRMSIVGPRPHAIAHNEMYRKLIKGYMVRHKVKPGITGWAQVNGLRGETDTLDKMKARIDYDLDYLRNWSLRFDLYIIVRTIWVVLAKRNAY